MDKLVAANIVAVDDVVGCAFGVGFISSICISCSIGMRDSSPPGCGMGGNLAKACGKNKFVYMRAKNTK